MKTRQKIKEEIISTEQSYVESLLTLVTHYVHPLKIAKKLVVRPQTISALFANVELIANFHQTFLFAMQMDTTSETLSRVITKYADMLKVYAHYLANYTNALTQLSELIRNSKRFRMFLDKIQTKLNCTLDSFLIMPVQRIPRYELLLREMMKNTPTDHKEYGELSTAYTKIKNIACFVNKETNTLDSMHELLNIQSKIGGAVDLVQPHRKLVKRAMVTNYRIHRRTRKKATVLQSRQLFLFSDMLLYTKDNYKYKGHLYLSKTKVEPCTISYKIRREEEGKASASSASSVPASVPASKPEKHGIRIINIGKMEGVSRLKSKNKVPEVMESMTIDNDMVEAALAGYAVGDSAREVVFLFASQHDRDAWLSVIKDTQLHATASKINRRSNAVALHALSSRKRPRASTNKNNEEAVAIAVVSPSSSTSSSPSSSQVLNAPSLLNTSQNKDVECSSTGTCNIPLLQTQKQIVQRKFKMHHRTCSY